MKEVVIGIDGVWWKDDGYFLVGERGKFTMFYEISRRTKQEFSPGIVRGMLLKDPNMTSYAFRNGVLEEDRTYITESNNYPSIFGLVFNDDFYMRDQLYHRRGTSRIICTWRGL